MGIIFLSFPLCLIQIILIGEGGGEGAVFLGSSPLEQKYIKHGDITCITYEIIPKYVNYDHLGECSPEKDCLW